MDDGSRAANQNLGNQRFGIVFGRSRSRTCQISAVVSARRAVPLLPVRHVACSAG